MTIEERQERVEKRVKVIGCLDVAGGLVKLTTGVPHVEYTRSRSHKLNEGGTHTKNLQCERVKMKHAN